MAHHFQMPQLSGSDREQLAQLKSFLIRFLRELEFTLNAIDVEIEKIKADQQSKE
jgi:hypothetical protein